MISDKAIIDKNFKIESSIEVGPFSVISKDVKIGKNTKIHSHVVITGDHFTSVFLRGKSGVSMISMVGVSWMRAVRVISNDLFTSP